MRRRQGGMPNRRKRKTRMNAVRAAQPASAPGVSRSLAEPQAAASRARTSLVPISVEPPRPTRQSFRRDHDSSYTRGGGADQLSVLDHRPGADFPVINPPPYLKFRKSGGGWSFLVGIRNPSAVT